MNQKNIAEFIAYLRKRKNLTQQQLADMIPISRQAVSKWERGVTIPDPDTLLRLSDIFGVTINEMLTGKENITEVEKDKLTLNLYTEKTKKSKIIKIMIIILLIMLVIFLSYYFVNSYRSVEVYTIYAQNDNLYISNGMLFKTREKIYFSLGDIVSTEGNISSLELYYYDDKEQKIVMVQSTKDSIVFSDEDGYNEYFDFDNFKHILNFMYLIVTFENENVEEVKLEFDKDYINDDIFFSEEENIIIEDIEFEKAEDEEVIQKIKGVSIYNEEEGFYEKKIDYENNTYNILYDDVNNYLIIDKISDDNKYEQYIYYFNYNILSYVNSRSEVKFSYSDGTLNCEFGDCSDYEYIIDEFWNILNNIN